jgi:hypothetical protein
VRAEPVGSPCRAAMRSFTDAAFFAAHHRADARGGVFTCRPSSSHHARRNT